MKKVPCVVCEAEVFLVSDREPQLCGLHHEMTCDGCGRDFWPRPSLRGLEASGPSKPVAHRGQWFHGGCLVQIEGDQFFAWENISLEGNRWEKDPVRDAGPDDRPQVHWADGRIDAARNAEGS